MADPIYGKLDDEALQGTVLSRLHVQRQCGISNQAVFFCFCRVFMSDCAGERNQGRGGILRHGAGASKTGCVPYSVACFLGASAVRLSMPTSIVEHTLLQSIRESASQAGFYKGPVMLKGLTFPQHFRKVRGPTTLVTGFQLLWRHAAKATHHMDDINVQAAVQSGARLPLLVGLLPKSAHAQGEAQRASLQGPVELMHERACVLVSKCASTGAVQAKTIYEGTRLCLRIYLSLSAL